MKTRNMIRETITELTAEYKGDRTRILDVTLGDPTKYGAPFLPPRELTEAMVEAVRSNQHNGYVAAFGTEEARKAVAGYVNNPDYEKVFITAGCSSAIDIAFRSLAGPGEDVVMVPAPGFPLYETLCVTHGIKSRRYALNKDRDWEVDLEAIKTMRGEWGRGEEEVKCVVVTNPSNPCGSVYSRDHLLEILTTIRALFPSAVVLADEVYEEVVFGEGAAFFAMGSFHDDPDITNRIPPVVTVSSIAKGYCAPGWRVGWISARGPISPHFCRCVRNLSMTTMGATTLLQAVLPSVLVRGSHQETSLAAWKRGVGAQLAENAARFVEALEAVRALEVYSLPRGAMYCYFGLRTKNGAGGDLSSPVAFARRLLEEEGVLVLPGTCFGSDAPSFRASIAVPLEVLMRVAEGLRRFCERWFS